MKCIWSILAVLSACLLIATSHTSRAGTVVIDLTRWTPPDISTVGDDPFGELVKYGHDAERMLSTICQDDTLEKERFFVEDAGGTWHVDVYSGILQGVVIADH